MENKYPYSLVPLPYPYDALEPNIDLETLHFHHDKHMKTYVENLNKVLEPYPELHNMTLLELLLNLDKVPDEIKTQVKNNGGGVFNHQLYFESMNVNGKKEPDGVLSEKLLVKFGSMENLKNEIKDKALAQFGSGYAWLVVNPDDDFMVVNLPNQETPLPLNLKPLLLVDVWEHAYYLKYQNRRAAYLDNWLSLIDWQVVEERYNSVEKL